MTTPTYTFIEWMTTDPRVPLHLRVAVLAYRHADATDTLFLDPGQLAKLVGAPNRNVLGKAVSRAIEVGFLDARSGTTALRLAAEGERHG